MAAIGRRVIGATRRAAVSVGVGLALAAAVPGAVRAEESRTTHRVGEIPPDAQVGGSVQRRVRTGSSLAVVSDGVTVCITRDGETTCRPAPPPDRGLRIRQAVRCRDGRCQGEFEAVEEPPPARARRGDPGAPLP